MNKTTLKQLIGKINRKELMEIISQMAQADSISEQILLDYCQKNATQDNKKLILGKQLKKHWINAYKIIYEANTYGGCSESDEEEVCEEVEIIQKIVEENEILWNTRKEILDSMLEQIAYDNSGFTDMLVDVATVICNTNEEQEYLADFLAEKGNNYYKGYATTIYRKIGLYDKFLRTKKANLVYGSDYLELADYYKKHGKGELALQTVWDGLDKCDGRLDEIYQYLFKWYYKKDDEATLWKLYKIALTKRWDIECITDLMYKYCKERQDYQHQKEMLISLVSCCDSRKVAKWYKHCREDLTSDDWTEQEPHLMEQVKQRNVSAYLDLCLEKGKKDEVLNYIISHSGGWNSIDSNHRYSKILAKDYPDVILKLYWNEVNQFIGMGKEKNYNYAVAVMKEIRAIMRSNKRAEEWNSQLARIKLEHSRKKLFMQAIADKL